MVMRWEEGGIPHEHPQVACEHGGCIIAGVMREASYGLGILVHQCISACIMRIGMTMWEWYDTG